MPATPPRVPRRAGAALAALAALALASAASAYTVPDGFTVVDAVPGVTFNEPTAFVFTSPNRFLVAEQRGVVHVVNNGVKRAQPFVDLQQKVLHGPDDRGLLDLALDPNFAANKYVYLLYTVDPDTNGNDSNSDGYGRIERYTVSAADSNVLDLSTRVVLMGRVWNEGPTIGSITHTIGSLRWGEDGSLLVSAGDGAQYTNLDPGGLDAAMFGAGKADPVEDIGAFRAQYLNSLCGKILRIDPATGHGYPSNPFWDGNPASNRSKVWAYGLRNPFRFAVRPGSGSAAPGDADPGTLAIGDVGWETWEELDVAPGPGINFGWPCHEGGHDNPPYQAAAPAHSDCATIGTPANPSLPTMPVSDWHHADPLLSNPQHIEGIAAVAGQYYTGTSYPYLYRGALFYADYGGSWVRVALFDSADQLIETFPFGSDMDFPVCFQRHPTNGDLYFISIFPGRVMRLRYDAPLAVEPVLPAGPFSLSAPWPNPAAGDVRVSLALDRELPVRFEVMDAAGRRLWSEPETRYATGRWVLAWPGLRGDGAAAPTGLYFLRVVAGGREFVRRVALIR